MINTAKHMLRPLRSVLYMPASNKRALDKSFTINADAFIYDLEDAVAPERKELARGQAVEAVSSWEGHEFSEIKTKVIRINGNKTSWYEEDLKAVRDSLADAILLPKAETPEDITTLDRYFDGKKQLWAMIETPLGVLNALQIAGSSENLKCLVVGTVDLANDLRCLPAASDRWNLTSSLQQILLAARAMDCAAIDGVYIKLDDEVGLEKECYQGRHLGFDGKTIIHPKTVDIVNKIFSPSAEEVKSAQETLQAYHDGKEKGLGATVLNGKLVEELHARNAIRTLEIAKTLKLI